MKILITGGHLTPALALIDKLRDQKKDNISIVFVGRKYALDSEHTLSLEYKEVIDRNIPFIPLQAGRITRVVTLRGISSIFKVPLGFIHAFLIVKQERPDMIFSFGGYIALPIVIAGWILGKKIYTHEQTLSPGLANKVIAFFSKKVFVSFPDTKRYFPQQKTILSGNPVRRSIFTIDKKPFNVDSTLPVIYITGGSLGSHSINIHIKAIVAELVKSMVIIHQTGDVKEYDDYEKLVRYRRSFPEEFKNRYILAKHFYNNEIGYVYSVSDVIVGRSGANTFFEAIHLQKPAIFIPLPWSAHKEQQHHASFFKEHGIGEIFEQKDPSEQLLHLLQKIVHSQNEYKKHFNTLPLQIKQDAADVIIKQILSI